MFPGDGRKRSEAGRCRGIDMWGKDVDVEIYGPIYRTSVI